MWETFKKKYYDDKSPISVIGQFRIYLQREFETRLRDLPSENLACTMDPTVNAEQVRVAMIAFAYNNPNIIDQLKQRGRCINDENWDELRKVNQKMTAQFRINSNNVIDQVQRPVSCFMTFEYEEGKERAMNYNEIAKFDPSFKHYQQLLGEPMHIIEAPEPSDIIWENRYFKNSERIVRGKIVFVIMCIVLSISFFIILVASNQIQALYDKYPEQNCRKIEAKFAAMPEEFLKTSINEFDNN